MIGLDKSIAVCRSEGYPVIEVYAKSLNVKTQLSLTISYPPSWKNGYTITRKGEKNYTYYDKISYEELWRQFEEQDCIKSFCDFENNPIPSPLESPSFHDFLQLSQILNSYCGIQ